jgi:hypothetical protein
MLWLLAVLAAVAAGSEPVGTIAARRRVRVLKATKVRQAIKAKPVRMARKEEAPWLKLFGDSINDTATYLPVYMKSLGCKDFRWGLCVQQYLDSLDEKAKAEGAKAAESVAKARDFIMDLLKRFYGPEMAIAGWLLTNICLRWKFPLEAMEDQWGAQGWVINKKSGLALANAAPPHPLPPRVGWQRAWFTFGTNRMRSDAVVTILFAQDDVLGIPLIVELASTEELRGALRMDVNYGTLPSPEVRFLADSSISCGKAKFWLARAKKASPEFR